MIEKATPVMTPAIAILDVRGSGRDDHLTLPHALDSLHEPGATDADSELASVRVIVFHDQHAVIHESVGGNEDDVGLFPADDVGFDAHADAQWSIIRQTDPDPEGL